MTRQQPTGCRYVVLGGVVASVLLFAVLMGYVAVKVISFLRATPTLLVVQTEVTPTVAELEPLSVIQLEPQEDMVPSVLDLIQFPKQAVTYPEAWPQKYRLPEALVLVAVEDGELGGRTTLSGKYLVDASPDEVSKVVTAYLTAVEWQIVEMVIEGEQQLVIVAEEIDGSGNGFFVVGADPDGGSRVMVTLVVE